MSKGLTLLKQMADTDLSGAEFSPVIIPWQTFIISVVLSMLLCAYL